MTTGRQRRWMGVALALGLASACADGAGVEGTAPTAGVRSGARSVAPPTVQGYGVVAAQKRYIAPLRPDLLARYIDTQALADRIDERLQVLQASSGRPNATALLYGDPLCAMYQLLASPSDPGLLTALTLEARTVAVPGAYLTHMLVAILTDVIPVEQVLSTTELLRTQAENLVAAGTGFEARHAMARYLLFADAFDVPFDDVLVGNARAALFPGGIVPSAGPLDTSTLLDMNMARFLDLEIDEVAFVAALDDAWTGAGWFDLADCPTPTCALKSVHQVVWVDLLYGIVPEAYLVDMAALLVSNVGDDGMLRFPLVLGLDGEVLLASTFCDAFCSVKMWHVLVALHHLVARLEPYEDEIKARALTWELR